MSERRPRTRLAAPDVLRAAALIEARRQTVAVSDVFSGRADPADGLTLAIAFAGPTMVPTVARLPRAVAGRVLEVALAIVDAELNALGIDDPDSREGRR